MYLGVDVKAMALGVLEESQLLPKLEDDAPPEAASGEEGEGEDEGAAGDATDDDDLEDAAAELQSPGKIQQDEDATEESAAEIDPGSPLEGKRRETAAYWEQLRTALQEESNNRTTFTPASQNWQLFDFLTRRRDGHQLVVDVIDDLPSQAVDPEVLEAAQRVRQWHADGVQLFGRALDLLTDSSSTDLTGPLAQSWQSAATQHRMEEQLIKEKLHGVENYLLHRWKAE